MSRDSITVLNGLYEFNNTDMLGKGSFGIVYKGRVIKTNEIVAIKALNRSLLQIQNQKFMIDQLKKEINLMQELKSDHIVRIYDLVGTETHIYIIIEYCSDGDLRQLLEKNNYNLTESQSISILKQILQGFKSMIDQGYVHRDIKPENILINSESIFKIADFGFATKIQDQNAQVLKECVGSPLYMSPQLLQQKPYSSKSDIWSIGLLYYEILFGKLPWLCRDINSLLIQIRKVPVRFPFDKPVSDFSKDFIKGCLQFEEYKRFSWEQVFNHELLQVDEDADSASRANSYAKLPTSTSNLDINKTPSKQNLTHSSDENARNNKIKSDNNNAINSNINNNNDQSPNQKLLPEQQRKQQRDNAQPKLQSPSENSREASPTKQERKQNEGNLNFLKKPFQTEHILEYQDQDSSEINNPESSKMQEQTISNTTQNKSNQDNEQQLRNKKNKGLIQDKENLQKEFNTSTMLKKSVTLTKSMVVQKNKLKELNKTDRKILMMLQDVVSFYNINLKDLFDRFDVDGDGKLIASEFYSLLKKLDRQIKENQAIHLFEILDKSENGFMLYNQFESMFNEWDFSNLQDRAQIIINELKEIVKVNKLDLQQIFKNFDKGQGGNLNLNDFEQLILLIAPGIKKNEIKYVFEKFDLNKDSQISFNEFNNIMTRKIFLEDEDTNLQTKQISNIIKELKSVLLSKNISTDLVFKNFTKKNHPFMKIGQLKKLARIVDDSIDENGINLLFRYMDIDNDGEISLEEFKTSLEL